MAARHDLKVYVVSDGPLRAEAERARGVRPRQARVGTRRTTGSPRGRESGTSPSRRISRSRTVASRTARGWLRPNGREFTEDSIGEALAKRELMDHLRQMGAVTGGPAPFVPADRSRFLARLEEAIQAIRRQQQKGAPPKRCP